MSTQGQPMTDRDEDRGQPRPLAVEARHDFTAKLRQPALLPGVLDYVAWQRASRAAAKAGRPAPAFPDMAPLSINLDLTTACNYACDHCIDWDILNSPIKYDHQELLASLGHMADRGLRSVILIGGGEPTIYPGFVEVVRFLKQRGLQVSVVTNGSRNDRILEIMPLLEEGDWVRLSLDSGTDATFEAMHKPKKALTLTEICASIPRLREANPAPLIGFSYIIVWRGAEREEGVTIHENIDEIVAATELARSSRFSYISLKPFLTRRPGGAEVMDPEVAEDFDRTVARIRTEVDKAKLLATPDFKVVESINLKLLEQGDWRAFTDQPRTCHMQALRQVLSPLGLYNCPAHRGVAKATIGDARAYADDEGLAGTRAATARILDGFDASRECREVTCLYHTVNWYLEDVIEGRRGLGPDDAVEDRNDFFL
ncbi:MAG: radical SAM protein [Planctomycetota bacterium]